jgi:hypothetical protein
MAPLLVLALAAPAGAVKNLPLVCQAAGMVNQVQQTDGTWVWTLNINVGQCTGDFSGPYAILGVGSGTSDTLGLCDGNLLVQNLNIDVSLALFSSKGPSKNKFLTEHWFAPISTFPVATPFLVADATTGSLVGGGAMLTRIGLGCPPGGSPGTLTVELRISPS